MDYSNLILNPDVSEEELDALSDEERKILLDMVTEFVSTGSSNTLKSLWYEDYDEVPVDIDTFIDDPDYLGNSVGGDNIYPFWRGVLRQLFAPGSKYFECILSGAIGIGKTTIADIGLAYMLHKLLCLKHPQEYYGLTRSSIMTVNFFNVTKMLGYGVSYAKLQSMLIDSPWFLDHGTLVGREKSTYVPDKNIQICVGSQVEHALGQDVFCVTGDTEIQTSNGVFRIEDLDGREDVEVYQKSDGDAIDKSCPCEVSLTGYTDELIEIEFEDGGILRCTPSHKIMLMDGSYKRACDLDIDDELYSLEVSNAK